MTKKEAVIASKRYQEKELRTYESLAASVEEYVTKAIRQELPDIKVVSITHRAKNPDSYRKKLEKEKYVSTDQITDKAGIRIILYREGDFGIVSAFIERLFRVDKKNSVDKRKELGTDRVGYRARHFIVRFRNNPDSRALYEEYLNLCCEIQITSIIAHAWSEINHDKGYKVAGTLPASLERKRYLIAGLLEVADKELNSYTRLYDNYVKTTKKKIEKSQLNETLNSVSLQCYIKQKFKHIKEVSFRDEEQVLLELEGYGLNTIKELDAIIPKDYVKRMKDIEFRSIDGIVRNVMIIHDADRYFKYAWNHENKVMDKENYNLYLSYGIEIDEICKRRHIEVV